MSDRIVSRDDTLTGTPRLTFINPRNGGDHVAWNQRYHRRDEFAEVEFIMPPEGEYLSIHMTEGEYLSIHMTEGHTTEAGNLTTRTIAMSMNKDRAKELYAFLGKALGDEA